MGEGAKLIVRAQSLDLLSLWERLGEGAKLSG